ncbi:MAG: DnaA/Hda family protein [Roseobacter sp.]
MPKQLGLNLPSTPALGREDFLIAPSNAVAFALIEGWQGWTAGKLLLCGPAGAGKSHLARVWAETTKADIIAARDLGACDIPQVASKPLVVEDVPDIAGRPECEEALFHLHNLMQAEGFAMLLTGQGAPKDWGIALPDLASRIIGTPAAQLEMPDDALLAALLAKLFADRQLAPAPDLIEYLVRRIERSFEAARDIVSQLDAASLAEKRPITRAFAARVLDKAS